MTIIAGARIAEKPYNGARWRSRLSIQMGLQPRELVRQAAVTQC